MKACFVTLGLALFFGAEANAVLFTWQFSGTADSGNWNGKSLAGLDYTLRLSKDAATPDGNFFSDFGQWFGLAAEIEIESLGTRTLESFAFIEQMRSANGDRLWIRGPGGVPQSDIYIPLGTLGDPDFLTPFGPVPTLGDGNSGLGVIDTTLGFELHDVDSLNGRITVSARTNLHLTIEVSHVRLCWHASTNKNYQLQYRSELTTNQWTDLGAPIPGNGNITCTNGAVVSPRRFYRIVASP